MATDKVPGKWQMTSSENFDAFMSALGIGYVTRKLGNNSKPLITINEEAPNEFSMKQESLLKTTTIRFKVGEEFDETTADGRKVKSLMALEKPNVLVHTMKATDANGKDSVCWREFTDKVMKCTCRVDDIETVRMYERVKS